jgi:cytoskeletal protein RodZ
MPPRTARTLGIVLAVLGLVAVIVAIVLLVRPADGEGAPTSTPVAPSASAASASTAPTETAATGPATQATTPATGASAAASPTEGVVASAAPGAATAAAAVLSFTASPATIDCAGDRTASVPVALSWQTEGGVSARLAVGSTDAQSGTPVDLSATGYSALSVPCRDAETLITLAVESPDGTLTQRTLVLPTD